MATKSTKRPAMRLVFSATQGSADAFVETEIQTGLSTLGKTAYRILEVGLQLSNIPNVNGANIEFALSRASDTTVAAINDRSMLYRNYASVIFTTSGATYQPSVYRWQPLEDANVIIVEEVIYAQLDSGSTSQTNVAKGYILIEPLDITEADRTALIAQSLGNY